MNVFLDYQKAILREFERKRLAHTLSFRLAHPTPAKIKEECIEAFTTRFLKMDEIALSSFFGFQSDTAAYLQVIKRADIDKFRPLINLIKGQVTNPDERNVELLAWLIDFKPRPWNPQGTYTAGESQTINVPENNTGKKVKVIPGTKPGMLVKVQVEKSSGKNENGKNKQLVIVIALLCLLCMGLYFIWRKSSGGLNNQEACMFWNVDHYEQISCNKKMGDIMVIALDSVKLRDFKKIMKEDTITYNSIGKVWYIKLNGKLEYYTARGKHPLNPALILRPVTAHIIDTYIVPDSLK